MDVVEDELRRLCRVCADHSQNMINLFIVKRSGLILSDMLSLYIRQGIMQSDTMPSKMCLKCINCLCSAHEFFTLARASQAKFQDMIDTAWLSIEFVKKYDFDNNDTEMMENSHIGNVEPRALTLPSGSPIVIKQNSPKPDQLSHVGQEQPVKVAEQQNIQLIDPLASSEVCELKSSADPLQLATRKQRKQQKFKPVRSIKINKPLKSKKITKPAINKIERAENVQPQSKYECYLCKKKLKTYAECREHLSTHIESQCEVCSVYLSSDGLKKDLCQGQSVQCEYCDETHQSTISLLGHLKCHKDQYRLHRCTCSKVFTSIFLMNAHKEQHNLDILLKPFPCDICGHRFNKRWKVSFHKRATHSTEKPHLCSDCGMGFKSNDSLKSHTLRHSSVKPFACTKCPSRFYVGADLRKHMEVHSDAKYICDDCGAELSSKRGLDSHTVRVHRKCQQRTCDICSLKCYSAARLKTHMRKHTGEKPYKCPECGRAFSQSGDLNKHRRTHVGENTYKCEKCQKAFKYSKDLIKHSYEHYQDEMAKELPPIDTTNHLNDI